MQARIIDVVDRWMRDIGLLNIEKGMDYAIYKEGNNVVYVKALYIEIPTESDVAKEIALMAKDRALYNKYYIATMPDILNFIDGSIIRKLGIGVLVVDGDTVKEVVKSIPIEVQRIQQASPEALKGLERELEEIKNRVKVLEDKVERIMSIIDEVRRAQQAQAVVQRSAEQAPTPGPVTVPEGAPSFLRDNPWLSIISSRRQEG